MISIAIPTHGMENREYFLTRCLDSLWNQTFQDFEIIVSDNSDDDLIETICHYYNTGIKYYRNPVKGMAPNTNEAIKRSSGRLIKIIYMDDFLAHNEALEKIVKNFAGQWLVTGCVHVMSDALGEIGEPFNPHQPVYSQDINTGHNTIGSPSVLTISNDDPLLFDENMTWLLDCDYYYRLYQKYGEPTVLKDKNVAIGIHEGQATNTMGNERKLQEQDYIKLKYA